MPVIEEIAYPKHFTPCGRYYQFDLDLHYQILQLFTDHGWNFTRLNALLHENNAGTLAVGKFSNDENRLRWFWLTGQMIKRLFYLLLHVAYEEIPSGELYALLLKENQKISAHFLMGNQTVSYFFPRACSSELNNKLRALGYDKGIRSILGTYGADVLEHNYFASDANLIKIEREIERLSDCYYVEKMSLKQRLKEWRVPPSSYLHEGTRVRETRTQKRSCLMSLW